MIYVSQNAAQYAIVIVASVLQNVFQDAINVIVLHVFAAHLIVIILVAVYAFALLANVI